MRIRPSLDDPTNVAYLEFILKEHQKSFEVKGDRKGDPVHRLYDLAQCYIEGLWEVKGPTAAMEFLRRLIGSLKGRMEFNERFTESWIVSQQLGLYQMMKEFGNNPVERRQLIQEAKSMVEQITPESWDDNNFRTLRDMRAQIVQYQAAEEGERYKDPLTRNSARQHLVAIHKEILKLESEFKTASAEGIRSRSLRAICGFKEEQGKNNDYQDYARELHKSMTTNFQLAKSENNITPLLAYELLSSHVALCKAYARAEKWDEVVGAATNGLKVANDISWDDNNRAHVEICQLLVCRSRGYLNLKQPVNALDDAREAVKEANSIPWTEEHPDEDVRAEYPKEYSKYRWQNFAQLNLIDIVYDLRPEELFGLVEAGLQIFTSSTLPDPEKDFYETQYRRKRIRALRSLERWHDVLAECQVLLKKSVEILSSSDVSHLKEIVSQMVDTCEDAVTCLDALGKINLSHKLDNETEAFEIFISGDIPLKSYIARARRLHRRFDAIYKATTADPRRNKQIGTPLLSQTIHVAYTKQKVRPG